MSERTRLLVEEVPGGAASARRFEIVERKGLGHPDTICDAVMEEAARALARLYLDASGQVQHFNLDKALLAAGTSSPRFGGGTVDEPIRFIFGDRAVLEDTGRNLGVTELVKEAAEQWFRAHFRYLDPERHVTFQSELRGGSAELAGLYRAEGPRANDTSIGVGFAPLTETERLVLAAEQYLNDDDFKRLFPETGEDVKVLGIRTERELALTVALAFVDRLVDGESAYFRKKKEVEGALATHLSGSLDTIDSVTVEINTLDEPGRGERGTYLTVTGTSADGADSGQVGRGNRLVGFSSAIRPWSAEAVAGKNPLCHVGKVYNHLAQRAAEGVSELPEVSEASVFLVSRIGSPIREPQFVAVRLVLEREVQLADVTDAVRVKVDRTLADVESFVATWLGV